MFVAQLPTLSEEKYADASFETCKSVSATLLSTCHSCIIISPTENGRDVITESIPGENIVQSVHMFILQTVSKSGVLPALYEPIPALTVIEPNAFESNSREVTEAINFFSRATANIMRCTVIAEFDISDDISLMLWRKSSFVDICTSQRDIEDIIEHGGFTTEYFSFVAKRLARFQAFASMIPTAHCVKHKKKKKTKQKKIQLDSSQTLLTAFMQQQ